MSLNLPPGQASRLLAASEAQRHYARYEEWKGWTSYFEFSAEEAEYFAGELRDIPLVGQSVFEVGFGSGGFLAWARARGARVAGAEINARSLREAKRFDVELLDAVIENIAAAHKNRFDVIVAFDVLEHFDIDELYTRIRAIEMMLRPGGFVVMRFPNGQSPFGLAPQNGDITHKTAISRYKIEQLCEGTTLTTVRYAGAYRIGGRWGAKRVARVLRTIAQRVITAILNTIYAVDIPWDSVVVLVMRRESVSRRSKVL